VLTGGQQQPPLASRRAGQPQVGVPAEADGHRPVTGRHDGGRDAQRTVVDRDVDDQVVGKRERGEQVGPGAVREAGAQRVRGRRQHLPAPLCRHRAVDGKPVGVGAELQALEIDLDTVDLVPPPAQPVGPRREQWQPGLMALLVARHPAREVEQLLAAEAQRRAEHPDLGREGRLQPTRPDGQHLVWLTSA